MISKELGQQLHDRATRGETLSPAEQALIAAIAPLGDTRSSHLTAIRFKGIIEQQRHGSGRV